MNHDLEKAIGLLEQSNGHLKAVAKTALDRDNFEVVGELGGLIRDILRISERISALQPAAQSVQAEKTSDEITTDAYPRFFRRGSHLIKQSLRSDNQTVYEQRMSRDEFVRVLTSIAEFAQAREGFHSHDALASISKMPHYKVYLALNTLKQEGYLDNTSQGIYRFSDRAPVTDPERTWQRIPTRG